MYKVTILWKTYGNETVKTFKRKNLAIHYLTVKLRRGNVEKWNFEEVKNAEA